jgi:DUF1680 family protein
MLYGCWLRAGQKHPPAERDIFKLFALWTGGLRGSEIGRFLMAATNTLRWIEHPERKHGLETAVDGIAECQEADGYVHAFDRSILWLNEKSQRRQIRSRFSKIQKHENTIPG